jgi:hypothetical protein
MTFNGPSHGNLGSRDLAHDHNLPEALADSRPRGWTARRRRRTDHCRGQAIWPIIEDSGGWRPQVLALSWGRIRIGTSSLFPRPLWFGRWVRSPRTTRATSLLASCCGRQAHLQNCSVSGPHRCTFSRPARAARHPRSRSRERCNDEPFPRAVGHSEDRVFKCSLASPSLGGVRRIGGSASTQIGQGHGDDASSTHRF